MRAAERSPLAVDFQPSELAGGIQAAQVGIVVEEDIAAAAPSPTVG